MSRRSLLPLFFLLSSATTAVPLAAWGALGHEMAARLALKDLPPELAAWFAGEAATLPEHANDPDHWKHRDPEEGPRHFLDCEAYGGPAGIPASEDQARARLGAERFRRSGQVPWAILARVHSLAEAFNGGDAHQVALEAAYLCHYTADCQVPLHATVNYNGADTGQHGVHGRWETGLLKRVVQVEGWEPEVRPAVLREIGEAAPLAWLAESFALVPGVLAADKAASRGEFQSEETLDEAYWRTFLRRQRAVIQERLTLSGQRSAEMILLAWNQAGSPLAPRGRRPRRR